ncbi:MAG: large terminase protein [Siphoviridae sp. ctdEk19]|nr:MAG: large terminase protein [Siphoviridae sp. ctdEk19]
MTEPQNVWSPQPGPQTHLVTCPVFEVFYGGARGGGKTESSLGDWLLHASQYGQAATGVFFRRKFKQLEEVIARSKQIFDPLGAKYNEQKAEWRFPNAARLKFRYLERDSDAEEYQGHNYTRLYIEELTNFPSPAPVNRLRATLRSPHGVPCGMRATGNPGGPGHNWVKARYIDPAPAGYKVLTETFQYPSVGTVSLERVFIPAKVSDNQLLLKNDPSYIARLHQSGSEQLVRAWLEGDWEVIDGAFFTEWDEGHHVLNADEWLAKIPRDALRFRAFDWGFARPFSCGWYAVSDGKWGLPKGALLKYREWYGSSAPNTGVRMEASLVAEGVKDREKLERIRYGVADPSIFIRDGGPSIAEMMAIKGIQWRRADNKRVPGWQQLRHRLVGEGGQPMLYLLDCCQDTIRTLPTLQHEESNVEDLDTDGEDHAADETRYACMSRPWVPRPPAVQGSGLPTLPSETTINQLIERAKRKRLALAA